MVEFCDGEAFESLDLETIGDDDIRETKSASSGEGCRR